MRFFERLFPRNEARTARKAYRRVIDETASMVHDRKARALARKRKLAVVDLTWEDTARYKGSCVGPNISDMTIQVEHAGEVTCMPVIRPPNFSDKTADVSIDAVFVRVGNARGAPLERVSLRTYLGDLRRYLSAPGSWAGDARSLLTPDEEDALVSAQACFLPVPKQGAATFNPVLFNYQSTPGSPAVLAIVANRQGTSATVIDNQRDAFRASARWGQRLFFNESGERASFTGQRLEEFVEAGGDSTDAVASMDEAKDAGLQCMLLIQVPLKQPRPEMPAMAMCLGASAGGAPVMKRRGGLFADAEACDVDEAVIGHGATEGPFTEIDGHRIERDPRFPVRVTVQFYKATSNGVVDGAALADIAAQIESVYRDAETVGSLVCAPDDGRSTAWDDEGRGKAQPAGWWADFWARQEEATGKSRAQLLAELEQLLGRRPAEGELHQAIRDVFGA